MQEHNPWAGEPGTATFPPAEGEQGSVLFGPAHHQPVSPAAAPPAPTVRASAAVPVASPPGPAVPGPVPPLGMRVPGSRPSPRRRPGTATVLESPVVGPLLVAPYPAIVTDGDSPVSSLQSSGEQESVSLSADAEENGEEVSSLQSSLQPRGDTLRDWLLGLWSTSRAYWTPPSVLTDRPASVAELAAYARWGGWTSSTEGPLRRLGVCWHYAVGLPTTVACRYAEWIAQRPGRALPVYLIWKLLISTGPGPWAVEHVINPVLGFVAWVLL